MAFHFQEPPPNGTAGRDRPPPPPLGGEPEPFLALGTLHLQLLDGRLFFSPGAGGRLPIRHGVGELMAGFLLFSCGAAGMGNLINSGGRCVNFSREKPDNNAAFLAFVRVLRSKTGTKNPIKKTSPVRRLSTLN